MFVLRKLVCNPARFKNTMADTFGLLPKTGARKPGWEIINYKRKCQHQITLAEHGSPAILTPGKHVNQVSTRYSGFGEFANGDFNPLYQFVVTCCNFVAICGLKDDCGCVSKQVTVLVSSI
jgi:hypothetical protein